MGHDTMEARDGWSSLRTDYRSFNELAAACPRSTITVQFYTFRATRLFWDVTSPENDHSLFQLVTIIIKYMRNAVSL